MEKIYAPWRSSYITKEKKKIDGCVFCAAASDTKNDKKHYVVHRYKNCIVLLNLYPYNAGHLLVIPNTHHAALEELTQEVRAELMEATMHACTILKSAVKAESLNVGINFGSSAGGGIPEHLHIHVLPRWSGDTNFMPLLCNTKAISTDLNEVYDLLHDAYKSIVNSPSKITH